jgi:protoporphyrinogen oxidase
MNRIVIIGGGISGLAAAHRVQELNPSINVTLLEASARLGGTIQTEYRDGFLLERGPDSFISEKPQALALANASVSNRNNRNKRNVPAQFHREEWPSARSAGRISTARAVAYVAVHHERHF